MATAPLVLVIDDDRTLSDVVGRALDREGFAVELETDGRRGLARALAEPAPDLVVLDLMLPGLDGFSVCQAIRAERTGLPVLMLTARGEEDDRVAGLEMGADDYLTKPFSLRELVARVRAVLRRSTDDAPEHLRAGELEIDVGARRTRCGRRELSLTAKEFELLVHLVRNAGRALRREELLEAVWGWTYGDTATVTVHVRRLREKLEADPSRPVHLQTVWGVGYRFDP